MTADSQTKFGGQAKHAIESLATIELSKLEMSTRVEIFPEQACELSMLY